MGVFAVNVPIDSRVQLYPGYVRFWGNATPHGKQKHAQSLLAFGT